ncbi:glycosyltransferase, partial [bacterium]|nr:glycosyltransferase [bacterium]
FERLGHRVTRLRFENDPGFVRTLLTVSLDADLLVTINHLGFDQHGELAAILEQIKLPYVSWFVDRPGFILLGYPSGAGEMANLFTWERSTITEIRNYGFERVEFLPLATDPERFTPGEDLSRGALRWVANSMVSAAAEWREKAGVDHSGLFDLFERAVALQQAGRIEAVAALQTAAVAEGIDIAEWDEHRRLTFASAVALEATKRFRHALAFANAGNGLHLYGDEAWREVAPAIPYEGHVPYPQGLPGVYRGGLHLNCTSYQMPSSVNQRVFDIPMCGGILITDDQEDMHELFKASEECVLFDAPEEAAERATFLLENPEPGRQRMGKAWKRIQKEHTYDHRARTILRSVQKAFGRVAILTEGGKHD